MKNLNKLYIYELVTKLFVLLLPIIIVISLANHNNITRIYLNHKFPHQLPNLNNDIIYFLNKNGYIDFRKTMKEEFNKIIVIDLKEDSFKSSISKYIKNNNLKIEFLEENKSKIRRQKATIEDYQLLLFLKDDTIIRYQEMNKLEHYYFDICKEKDYFKIYKFKQRYGMLEPF